MTLKVMTLLLFRSSKFAAYFQNTFSEHIWTAASHYYWHWFSCVVYILFKQYFFCVQVEFVTVRCFCHFFFICYDLVYFTTRVTDTGDTSATRTTKMQQEWEKNDMSTTRMTRVRHEWKILILITRRVKTYCHTTYISYIANERLQGEEQVHSKNYPLEMHLSHTKMRLKNAPQKQKFIIAKAISKIAKVIY